MEWGGIGEKKNVFFILLLVVLVANGLWLANDMAELKQLPGPIYGGDIYFHNAIIKNIANGNSPWNEAHFLNEYEHNPWLMHLMVASIAILLNQSTITASLVYAPVLFMFLGGVVAYFLGKLLFEDERFAFITAIAWIGFTGPIPIMIGNFTGAIIIPLSMLGLLYFLKKRNLVSAIFLGVVYGLGGLSHTTPLISMSLILLFLLLYEIYLKKFKIGINEGQFRIRIRELDTEERKKNVKLLLIALVIGILISMLVWAPAIFIYKGVSPNNWQQFGVAKTDFVSVIGLFAVSIKNVFLNFSNAFRALVTVLMFAGAYYIWKSKLTNWSKAVPLLFLLAGIVGILHPIITQPLLGISIVHYRFPLMFWIVVVSLMVFGVKWAHEKLETGYGKNMSLAFLILVILFSFGQIWYSHNAYFESEWVVGRDTMSPQMQALYDAGEWFDQNTDKNAVFLSPDQDSAFALSGLTARKGVIIRRSSTTPFVDLNKRMADAAVILYGNNPEKARELLEEYQVEYYYTDSYAANRAESCRRAWDQLEQNTDESLNCLSTSPEYEDYLKSYGIETKRINARLEPAAMDALKVDIVAIKPVAMSDLNQYFETLQIFNVEGNPAVLIAKVRD